MIVESTVELSVGEMIPVYPFAVGGFKPVMGRVMRAATEDEYIADCLADPLCPEETKKLMLPGANDVYWYDVSVD